MTYKLTSTTIPTHEVVVESGGFILHTYRVCYEPCLEDTAFYNIRIFNNGDIIGAGYQFRRFRRKKSRIRCRGTGNFNVRFTDKCKPTHKVSKAIVKAHRSPDYAKQIMAEFPMIRRCRR